MAASSNVLSSLPGQLPLPKFLSQQPTPASLRLFISPRSLPSSHFSSRKHAVSVTVKSLREDHSSSSSTLSPPSSREEAVSQAKSCLSSTLQKPLNNLAPLPSKRLKRQKQTRLRVEIPLADDDSPDSLSKLASDVFSELPIKKKGAKPVVHVVSDFSTSPNSVSADVIVFVSLEPAMIGRLRSFCEEVYPKPVVLFNPRWRLEEEEELETEQRGFVASFEVVYSFTGMEVKGLLSTKKAAVFRCVKDGIFSGETWAVLVEDEEKTGLKVVTRFRKRPSMAEVENVLYNVMAANSPVTKSVRFIKELVSNVRGK
ncbi:plant/protein (DUF1995) [Wolffia australiana]